jgi:hypothetical protein
VLVGAHGETEDAGVGYDFVQGADYGLCNDVGVEDLKVFEDDGHDVVDVGGEVGREGEALRLLTEDGLDGCGVVAIAVESC